MNMQQNNQKIGLCGFRNIGNTCYMNSTLQLLIHSKTIIKFLIAKTNPFLNNSMTFIELFKQGQVDAEFVRYLENGIITRIQEEERKKLNLGPDEIVQISKNTIITKIEHSFTIKLAEIINLIIYKGISNFTPDGFKRIVDEKIPLLRGYGQQDSHELLNGILDNMIDETGIETNIEINNVPENVKKYIRLLEQVKLKIIGGKIPKREIIKELNAFKIENHTMINRYSGLNYMAKIFKNKYNPMIQNLLTFVINTTICTNEACKIEQTNYQFNTIFLLHVKPSLRECFENFIEEEIVDKKCEMCSNTKAARTCKIWQPGMLLYIELCRFNNSGGSTSKNNLNIDIPNEINISNYCDQSNNLNFNNLNYKLKGVTNHMGSLNGGHYTSDCVSFLDNSTWHHFDDSNVYRYTESNINKSNSYMLLYELES